MKYRNMNLPEFSSRSYFEWSSMLFSALYSARITHEPITTYGTSDESGGVTLYNNKQESV